MNDTHKRKSTARVTALLFLCLFVILAGIVSSHVVSNDILSMLARGDEHIGRYIQTHKILSAFAFALLFTSIATFTLPFESAFCVLAGYYFKAVLGTVISIFSIVIGATLMFLFIRYFFKDWFRTRFQSRALTNISHGLEKDAFPYILFLRLVPLFPHLITNTALAISNVRARDYIVATFIGIIPSTTIFVLTGTQLENIKRTGQILTPDTLGLLLLLAFFALFPLLWKHFFSRNEVTS